MSYGYRQLGSRRTTGQVSSYQSEVNGAATAYTYTYDSNGNITRITDQSGKVTRYTYDKLGQLTREDNPYLNKTYVYTYDNAGNRLSKKTYAYTTGTPGNATATESYNYTGDRLTQVGSIVYQYDAIGNPTTYNGYTLEWNGRKLMEMSMNGGQFLYTFAYNADGIRTVKTNGSTIHHYTLNGSQIVTETWTTKSSSGAETPNHFLVYLYDENGAPIGLQYRNKSDAKNVFYTYYFEKNLQGDIIAIYTENGTKIGSYTYDAWGNCTVSTESGTTTIQKRIVRTLNPFRYRGYYYDTDTGLYYLQSRYYNPQWGRFLNADGYVSTGTGLLGYNMYAYCSNNPVMYTDPTGEFPWLTAIAVAVTAVVVIPTVVNHIVNGILSKYSDNSEITFHDDNAQISESYKVTSRYDRQKISEIIRRTGETSREYDHMSSEWLGHNVCYRLHIKIDLTEDVNIDYIKDSRWYVRAGTKVLEVLGWD